MPRTIKSLAVLPAERALQIIAGRWKALVLYYLFKGPKRLSQLMRLVPRASQKVLIQQLREMEAHGIVHREIFKEVPARVEYSATPLGASLEPVIASLCDWGRKHAVALNEIERADECATAESAVARLREPA
jgi:DNA-binding HxlR family transcriptional regulator